MSNMFLYESLLGNLKYEVQRDLRSGVPISMVIEAEVSSTIPVPTEYLGELKKLFTDYIINGERVPYKAGFKYVSPYVATLVSEKAIINDRGEEITTYLYKFYTHATREVSRISK